MVLVGFVMLLTPGPGVVMLIAGLVLIDNQRKTRLLEHLLAQPNVYEAVKKLHHRFGKPMFILNTKAAKNLKYNREKLSKADR